jgi:archaellum biogenesis ATPase FlaH
MDRVPFGIQRLDATIDGGAPAGSVVLVAGEAGAGAREFCYTSAVLCGLARRDAELFELHYGALAPEASLPEAIHYCSFTADEEQLRREIGLVIDEEIATTGLDAVGFQDLSRAYFGSSPVPVEWYADRTTDIEELGSVHGREDVLEALADRLDACAPGSLVAIDSLTDLLATAGDRTWADIILLVRGLAKAAAEWNGLVLIHVNREALSEEEYGLLTDAVSGTMEFAWESGGSSRARTMIVKHFRGVLPRIEAEAIVRFETDIGPTGFDISDVRKIR